jgi:hypothetical protein
VAIVKKPRSDPGNVCQLSKVEKKVFGVIQADVEVRKYGPGIAGLRVCRGSVVSLY